MIQHVRRPFSSSALLLALCAGTLGVAGCNGDDGGSGFEPPDNVAPTASITSPTQNTTIQPGQSVTFEGSGTDPDGQIASFAWQFPGGNPPTSTSQNPGPVTYAAGAGGPFTATLTVTDDEGSTGSATRLITVVSDTTPAPGPGTGARASLPQTITGTRTLSADTTYVITGQTNIVAGATLVVPAGTVLESAPGTPPGTLVTNRCTGTDPSGRLVVQGTRTNPVRFGPPSTGPRQRGQGGGVVLQGCAPVNTLGGTFTTEGIQGAGGGSNPTDSSGEIRYLTIAFGGFPVSPNNEINGLTMSGVGSGTVVENVQTHFINDDGFEWFGGTVNARFLVSSGNDDDNFDCDNGFSGTVQFFFAIEDRARANRGLECDNDAAGSDRGPLTTPRLFNATFVGAGVLNANNEVNDGLYVRRATAGFFRNLIVSNFGNAGVVIDGTSAFNRLLGGLLSFDNILFFRNQNLNPPNPARGQTDPVLANFIRSGNIQDGLAAALAGRIFVNADPQFRSVNFDNPINGTAPDPRPQPGSPALDPANASIPSGPGVDASARYLGAFNQDNWLDGWTIWALN